MRLKSARALGESPSDVAERLCARRAAWRRRENCLRRRHSCEKRRMTEPTAITMVRPARGRNRGRTAGRVRCLALFHRPNPHAVEAARGMPEEPPRKREAVCTIVLDPRWAKGLHGPGDRQPRRRALLDGPGAARSRDAGAAPLRGAARHICVALAGAAQSDRGVGRAACSHRGQRLSVVGLDCVDGTPLLDIKPYFASTDSVPDASVGWHAATKR